MYPQIGLRTLTKHTKDWILIPKKKIDRDPKLLNLDNEECRRRRRLFHELITLETWMVRLESTFVEFIYSYFLKCMIIERPPSVQGAFFSTEMPYDTHETLGDDPSCMCFPVPPPCSILTTSSFPLEARLLPGGPATDRQRSHMRCNCTNL
jgi:hypothetical protein